MTLASEAKCPQCGAMVKWSCIQDQGNAECQDGRMVSRRIPNRGPACTWRGGSVFRITNGEVVVDDADPAWRG